MSGDAGFDDAGEGDAGYGAEVATSTARAVSPPQAMFFDPAIMDFPMDDDGRYVEVHPVDQKVELRLAIRFGSVGSNQSFGSNLFKVQIGSRAAMTQDAARIVAEELSDMVSAGDVNIVSVVAYASNQWRAHVEVTYQNLRAPDADRNRTTVIA